MKTGQNGIALIKHFEGCKLSAYKCPAGKLTIGVGHTGVVNGEPIKESQKITQQEADKLLKQDLYVFEKGISQLVTVQITQNQFDAMVSLAFNIGLGAFKDSSVLKNVNKKDFNSAEKAFMAWVKVNGNPCQGLIRRRSAEATLFSQNKLVF
jgi:lysozyme